jgi:hypothetical protein
MRLGSLFLLMEDRSHPEIMFCGTEGIFYLGELDTGVSQNFRIGLVPVGTENVAAPGFQCPPVAILVFLGFYGKVFIVFGHGHGKKRGSAAISFKKATDLPLYFLFVSEPARICSFDQFHQLILKPRYKTVEYSVLFLFPTKGATENEGFLCPFR